VPVWDGDKLAQPLINRTAKLSQAPLRQKREIEFTGFKGRIS
jgi:hypothetical protein